MHNFFYLFVGVVGGLGMPLSLSQSPNYKVIKSVSVRGKLIRTDNLQNCYLVKKNDELVKYDKAGREQATYSNKSYGELEGLDCTNPLRLLLFYPNFNTVVLLDKYLTQQRSIDLSELNIADVSAVSSGQGNSLWVYDEREYQLKKVSKQLMVTDQSEDLSVLITPDLAPNFLVAQNNRLYLNDPDIGVLVFDQFGNYSQKIPVKHLESFQMIGNHLYYLKEGKLYQYNTKTLESETISLPSLQKDIKQVNIQGNHLYILTEKQLLFYKL